MPFLGIEAFGESHGIDQVSKEHAHLLALAFEGIAGGEDLVGEVSRGIGACVARRHWRADGRRERLAAGIAKLLAPRVEGRAARAGDAALERGPARPTEAREFAGLVPAVRAPHAWDSAVKIARRATTAVGRKVLRPLCGLDVRGQTTPAGLPRDCPGVTFTLSFGPPSKTPEIARREAAEHDGAAAGVRNRGRAERHRRPRPARHRRVAPALETEHRERLPGSVKPWPPNQPNSF